MEARELSLKTGDEVARLVRALGAHRYVAGRLHLVHAFVFAAMEDDATDDATSARDWAREVLAMDAIDKASRDERLWRRASEKEIAAALAQFWSQSAMGERTRARLAELLAAHGIDHAEGDPFDEAREEEMFPLLIDAGWELLALRELDPERHKGVIQAFDDFEVASFEENEGAYLQELPAIGPIELLHGIDDHGALIAPFVVWSDGPEAYHSYVIRGALRAAKIDDVAV